MSDHDNVPRQYRLHNPTLDQHDALAKLGFSRAERDALVRIAPVPRYQKPAPDSDSETKKPAPERE